MERRLAVILVADMVEYARRMQADQAETIALIGALRERWLEPVATAHGGEVLKRMGDGWIIAFDSVTAAIEAAMEVQQGLAGHPEIRIRLAAHLGEIAADGTDVYGSGINIAARLQTEAPPGGLMISEDLQRQLDTRIAGDFAEAGSFTLKNIAGPVRGFQWRPTASGQPAVDDLPVIAVESVAYAPDRQDLREAAADVHEQLVHRLSRRTGVRVLALDHAGAAEPGPTYLLRGRLRVRGKGGRLTLMLLLGVDGRAVWSQGYDGPADGLSDLCDDAVGHADNALRLQINAFDGERIAHLPDDRMSPMELRSLAAHLLYRATLEAQQRAIRLMERALRLDAANAMSNAMWVEALFVDAAARFATPDPATVAALAAACDRAVEGAPRSDYALMARAELRARLLGDIVGARRDIARIARLNPDYAIRHEAAGLTELATGDFETAAESFAACVAQSDGDPYLPFRLYGRSVALLLAGRPADAEAAIREAIELRGTCRGYRLLLAEALTRQGADAAAAEARAAAARLPDRPDILLQDLPLPEADRGLMAMLAPGGARDPSSGVHPD